jgi:hypothetical protein
MKTLPRGLIAVACSLLVLARAQAIAPWPMAGGNYFEGFGTIATWTDDFASPTEATRWGSVAVNGTGAIPDGRRTTVATSVFTTTTTGGVQRGAGSLIQLSTGSTDNTSANAIESPTLEFLFEDTSDAALARWNRDHQPHREKW